MSNEELIEVAITVIQKAYAPYSNFRVGAALLMGDGKVYTGCNIENASYGLTMCAERVALFKAVSEGHSDFKALAVVCDSENYCAPCGACRQVLAEFAGEMPVIMANSQKQYIIKTVHELLPEYFNKAHLYGGTV